MTRTLTARNPRTGEHDYEFLAADADHMAQLAKELRASQPGWKSKSLEERIRVLQDFKTVLSDHAGPIVAALSRDTGRLAIAKQELMGLMGSIDRWCDTAPELLKTIERPSKYLPHISIRQRLEPYPLVGAISPWNFPLLLSFIDVTPALLAGCAAIIKPSEVTPRFAEPVSQAINELEPLREVLRFAPGDGQTGAELIKHVDVVAFTGSVATGKKVAAAAANEFIPAFLELGGKDPVVILAGADLDRAATAILRASVAATGQACQSLERVYVHATEAESFIEKLKQKSQDTPLSYPNPNQGIVGPLIFAKQAEIIQAHLEDAVSKGAVIECGGEVKQLDGGFWIEPTVVSNVSHEMRLMQEETFGPVMPVMTFETEAEAVALANDSQYGLSAAVIGASEDEALRVAEQLNAGGVSVNDAGLTTMIFEEQKSAFRYSGLGPSRMGPSGLTRFFRNKAIYLNRGDVMPLQVMAEGQT